MNKPKTVPELLSGQGLEQAIQRSRQLNRLASLVKERLGAEFDSHCQVTNVRTSTLILTVASTVWASRLRYQVPRLLQDFSRDERLSAITAIDIRVSPAIAEAQKPSTPLRRASMSEEAAHCVRQCSESIDDPKLKSALARLAGRKRPASD